MESDNKGEKYMKKKGFTLIELLAVIVILAIIAVITVPKIADMISSSRQGGAEDSFYGTLKAAELGYTKALQSNTDLKGSTCTITDSKITCTNGVNIDVSGKTPESGTLVIDSSGSTIAKALTLNGYKCYGDLSTSNPCVKADVEVASEALIKKVTTSGDGLYKDKYEEGKYIFKGTLPNNYLTFNDENAGWRIISVELDGTLKVVKKQGIGDFPWDKPGNRDSSTSTYCTKASTLGCNAWAATNKIIGNPINFISYYPNGGADTATDVYKGSVVKNSFLNEYLNNEYYNEIKEKNYSVPGKFYVGTPGQHQDGENFITNLNQVKQYIWEGKIGLITALEYMSSSSNSNCQTLLDGYNGNCAISNWLKPQSKQWTISPFVWPGNVGVWGIDVNGGFTYNNDVYQDRSVYPVMYLKANIELTGNGTEADPYKIK